MRHNTTGDPLVEFLEKQFNDESGNSKYKDYYKVFYFGE